MGAEGTGHFLGPKGEATTLGPFFPSLSEQVRKITTDSPGANSSAKPGDGRDSVLHPSWDPQPHMPGSQLQIPLSLSAARESSHPQEGACRIYNGSLSDMQFVARFQVLGQVAIGR